MVLSTAKIVNFLFNVKMLEKFQIANRKLTTGNKSKRIIIIFGPTGKSGRVMCETFHPGKFVIGRIKSRRC